MNAINKKGQTALHLSVSKNKINSTKILISTNKIDINVCDEIGQTAIIKSCASNSDCTLALLDIPDIKVNIQDIYGNTALHYSMEEGNYKVSMMLIKKGVDCGIKNAEGKTGFDLLKDIQMRDILISFSENVKHGFSD